MKIFGSIALTILALLTGSTQQAVVRKIKSPYIYVNAQDSVYIEALKDTSYQLFCLLFHAEQDTIGLDPGLSTNGRWRAINLLHLLKDLQPKAFFTTPFRANILTIQPACDYFKLPYNYYDQADIKSLLNRIDNTGNGLIVMVTHPETFDNIFSALALEKYPDSLQGRLYDRIIFVQRKKNQKPRHWSFRYNIR